MKETREQILGKAIDRHLSVSAGAGSGKTRVLVNRFIHILEQHPDIDIRSIVAITFTRKAAAEMMKRVVESVEEQLNKAIENEHEDSVRLWDSIRKKLVAARISTIDSFCTQLVRDYPIEAGVPHNFIPISQSEAHQFRDESIEKVLTEFLDSSHESSELTQELFRLYPHRIIIESIQNLMMKGKTHIENMIQKMSEPVHEIIEHAVQHMWVALYSGLQQSFEAIHEIVESTESSFYKEEVLVSYNRSREIVLAMNEQYQEQWLQPLFEAANNLNTMLSVFVTSKYGTTSKYSKKYGTLDLWIQKYCKAMRENIDSINNFHTCAFTGEKDNPAYDGVFFADRYVLTVAGHILDIALEAIDYYEARKREQGLLEYNDVQSLAIELLGHPDASERIRSSIKYLMIDEFQDTNFTQYELALRIVQSLQGTIDNHDVNFYIVGDPKQSIYGFRAADVRVFGSATQDIIKANNNNPTDRNVSHKLDEEEYSGVVSLSVSFRLLPGIVAFVNELFQSLMGMHANGYEVAYQPMIAGRLTENLNEDSTEIGSVSILLHKTIKKSEKDTIEEAVSTDITESDLLAKKIKQIVLDKTKLIWDTRNNESGEIEQYQRYAQYKDITVLYARRTDIDQLMAALRVEGVPYFISGNKGFYTSPAITDFCSYLSFLNNPSDSKALAALLRSPFFSIEDKHLYYAVQNNKHSSLWVSFSEYAQTLSGNECDERAVIKAYEILSIILEKAERLSIPIVLHTIMELSSWQVIAGSMENGQQMLANADKLIELARDFEKRGFKNLHDFSQELQKRVVFDDEADAPIVNQEDAINLMTIHASKGLEFPIVALFDTNNKERKSSTSMIMESENYGVSLPIITKYRIVGNHETAPSLIQLLIQKEEYAKSIAEKKRLLYVALTRAKDHLIVSTSVQEGKEFHKNSQIDMIIQGIKPLGLLHEWNNEITTISLKHELLIHKGSETKPSIMTIEVPVSIESDIVTVNKAEIQHNRSLHNGLSMYEKATLHYKDEFYSPSQFLLLNSDENSFRKRYVLGFPSNTHDGAFSMGYDEIDEDVSSAKVGIMIHEAMEKVADWIDKQGTIREDNFTTCLNAIAHQHVFGLQNVQQTLKRIEVECRNIVQTGLFQQYISTISKAQSEYKVSIPVNDDFFVVIIDALIQSPEGDWEIWDWKTNQCDTIDDMEMLAKRYETQMKHYLYIVSLLYPLQKTYKARLLFTRRAKPGIEDSLWTKHFEIQNNEIPAIEQEIQEYIQKAKQSILL